MSYNENAKCLKILVHIIQDMSNFFFFLLLASISFLEVKMQILQLLSTPSAVRCRLRKLLVSVGVNSSILIKLQIGAGNCDLNIMKLFGFMLRKTSQNSVQNFSLISV